MDKKIPGIPDSKTTLSHQRGVEAPASKRLKLLVTIVNRNKADFYMDVLQSLEINMQLTVIANGTAKTEMLQYLGLSNTEKSVIFSIVREDRAKEALETLEDRFSKIRGGQGIAWTIPLSSVIGVAIYQFLSNNRMGLSHEHHASKEEPQA